MTTLYTVDKGATGFLNQAQRLLVRMYPWLISERRWSGSLAANAYVVGVPDAYKINQVWLEDSTDRYDLSRSDQQELEQYFAVPVSEIESDLPCYWCNLARNTYPLLESNTGRNILIWPPADAAYTVKVAGLFYPTALVNNADSNILTEEYPDALIQTAWACYLKSQGNLAGYEKEMASVRNGLMREVAHDHYDGLWHDYEDDSGLLEIRG